MYMYGLKVRDLIFMTAFIRHKLISKGPSSEKFTRLMIQLGCVIHHALLRNLTSYLRSTNLFCTTLLKPEYRVRIDNDEPG